MNTKSILIPIVGCTLGGLIGFTIQQNIKSEQSKKIAEQKRDSVEFSHNNRYKIEIRNKAPNKFMKLIGDIKKGKHIDWAEAAKEMRDSINNINRIKKNINEAKTDTIKKIAKKLK